MGTAAVCPQHRVCFIRRPASTTTEPDPKALWGLTGYKKWGEDISIFIAINTKLKSYYKSGTVSPFDQP